jgi:putative FmdB family regulatory protein
MPTYEYECQSCGQQTEKFQKINDEPLLICPHCKEPKLTQQVSAPAFQLKGTGWYVTDFRDKKSDVKEASNTKVVASETKTSTTEKIESNTNIEASK